MAKNVELLGSYWTLAGGAEPHTDREYSPFDFKDRVLAAARAGFKGIGIWHADLAHALQQYSLKEMKKILDGNGIKHIELEFLMDWFMEGEKKQQSDVAKKFLLDAAEAAGFELFVTADKNIRYQQNLTGRKIAIVVLGNAQWPILRRHVERVVAAVNAATPGSYAEVDVPSR